MHYCPPPSSGRQPVVECACRIGGWDRFIFVRSVRGGGVPRTIANDANDANDRERCERFRAKQKSTGAPPLLLCWRDLAQRRRMQTGNGFQPLPSCRHVRGGGMPIDESTQP